VKHEDCWAKTTPSGLPGISVAQHCRTAGIVAGLLEAQRPAWLASRLYSRNGVVLAALHDIGKVSPGFQKKCVAWLKRHGLTATELAGTDEDHAKVGQRTLQDVLGRDELRLWAALVGAHHGRLKGDRVLQLCDGGPSWAAERRRLVGELVREFGPLPDSSTDSNCGALWFNAGLIAVADWLASDERTFPPSKVLDSVEIRERAEEQLGALGGRALAFPTGKAFPDLFPFPPNAMQAAFTEAVCRPGVYVVEAAMGCGKTEAALMAAYNLLASGQASGVYFALPTQVTSNRIHRRLVEFMDRAMPGSPVRLIHGNSWLMDAQLVLGGVQSGDEKDREGQRDGRDWFASPRRALLAQFGVGTVDQALLGIVAAKHFFVRQYSLAGKVVILDEIHSYDLYTGTLIDALVTRLRELGATVIILSATLTAARRCELLGASGAASGRQDEAYPLISASVDGVLSQQAPSSDIPKTVQVGFRPPRELAEDCLVRARRGECVLWIRNTVQDAQESYRHLCGGNHAGGPEIGLLHARFPQFRREELESDWLERLGKDPARRPTAGCVLVATQVAEQSVDIDADLLVTDLAPTDMLLQRLGRLWRHPRQRPSGCVAAEAWFAMPELDVRALRVASAGAIKAAFGRSAKVYAPYVLLRSFALWCERREVTVPGDIRRILEATYAEPVAEEPLAWQTLSKEMEARRDELRRSALSNSNPWQVALEDEEGVQTRWNSCPSIAVVLVRRVVKWDAKTGASLELLNGDKCELRANEFDFGSAKAVHRNLVKVPRWCVLAHLAGTPGWMRECVRGEVVVCKVCDEQLIALPAGDETGLTYRADLGVVIRPQGGRVRPQRDEEEDDESYD
jgi:CRISPR-associated endonuclease/helicase Cas3